MEDAWTGALRANFCISALCVCMWESLGRRRQWACREFGRYLCGGSVGWSGGSVAVPLTTGAGSTRWQG